MALYHRTRNWQPPTGTVDDTNFSAGYGLGMSI